jgi:hypothetical protein
LIGTIGGGLRALGSLFRPLGGACRPIGCGRGTVGGGRDLPHRSVAGLGILTRFVASAGGQQAHSEQSCCNCWNFRDEHVVHSLILMLVAGDLHNMLPPAAVGRFDDG